jgi:PEP-CTERM motif
MRFPFRQTRTIGGITMVRLLAFACLCLVPKTARAEFVITIQQSGNNVVASGSGSINVSALHLDGPGVAGPFIQADTAILYLGAPASSIENYSGITGPTNIGSGASTVIGSSGSGSFIGVRGVNDAILLPSGYVSGSTYSDSATWGNTDFTSLGLALGTYTWTWGTGPTADSLEVAIVPEPSSFILLGVVAAGALAYSLRRRRPAVAA